MDPILSSLPRDRTTFTEEQKQAIVAYYVTLGPAEITQRIEINRAQILRARTQKNTFAEDNLLADQWLLLTAQDLFGGS
jgi:transposase-like protein